MKAQSKIRAWIWFFMLLLLFLTVSYFSFTPKPTYYPDYVSTSPSPTGVKALYTYLNNEKKVNRWDHTPNFLTKDSENQMLVMVEPSFVPEKGVMEDYVQYMMAGNTILLVQDNPAGMFAITTEPIKQEPSTQKKLKVYDQRKTTYKAEIPTSIRLQTLKEDEILLFDNAGPIAIKRKIGKGFLIVAVTPEWLTNDNLLKNNQLELVFHLLNEGKPHFLLFDEYLHGGENASTMLTVYPMWFLLIIFQGIILIFLWLWYKGKRFGPLFSPREETVRFSDEGIQAIAAWYLRGNRYHDSLLIQADYVKLLMQERWQIPYSKEWQNLASIFGKKWTKMTAREIGPFLNGLVAILDKEKISKQEYLLWSRKLEQLRKEVEA